MLSEDENGYDISNRIGRKYQIGQARMDSDQSVVTSSCNPRCCLNPTPLRGTKLL